MREKYWGKGSNSTVWHGMAKFFSSFCCFLFLSLAGRISIEQELLPSWRFLPYVFFSHMFMCMCVEMYYYHNNMNEEASKRRQKNIFCLLKTFHSFCVKIVFFCYSNKIYMRIFCKYKVTCLTSASTDNMCVSVFLVCHLVVLDQNVLGLIIYKTELQLVFLKSYVTVKISSQSCWGLF